MVSRWNESLYFIPDCYFSKIIIHQYNDQKQMKGRSFCLLLLLLFLLLSGITRSQGKTLTMPTKLASLCQVWGFLKYYHPAVSTSSLNWDSVLIQQLIVVDKINSPEQLHTFYENWLQELGTVEKCDTCILDTSLPDSVRLNLDFKWMKAPCFNKQIIDKLNLIKTNRNQHRNPYVYYDDVSALLYTIHEAPYKNTFPDTNYRLLALFRYWNIYNYFSPYKQLQDKDWNDALITAIPMFLAAKNTLEYEMAFMECNARVQDTHAQAALYTPAFNNKYIGTYRIPIVVGAVGEEFVIKKVFADSSQSEMKLYPGDVVLKIDQEPVALKKKLFVRYYAYSNEASLNKMVADRISYHPSETVTLTIKRGTRILTGPVKCISDDLWWTFYPDYWMNNVTKARQQVQQADTNIGYINIGLLEQRQVDSVMQQHWHKATIIFDCRTYPQQTAGLLANKLFPGTVTAYLAAIPDLKFPGTFKYLPIQIGDQENRNHYKGKIVILCNEETQSQAESMCLMFQQYPGAVTIGSQTAGANGNAISFEMPGGISGVLLSSIGILEASGRQHQRKGIGVDIYVKPTLEGVKQERDEVLGKAIAYILNKK